MTTHRSLSSLATFAIVGLALTTLVQAADVYHVVPVSKLTIVEGKLPGPGDMYYNSWWRRPLWPHAALDGPGEVYIVPRRAQWDGRGRSEQSEATIAIRSATGQDISGYVYLPNEDHTRRVALKFTLPQDPAAPQTRNDFLDIKLQHYEGLLDRDLPGAVWFRHQARLTRQELGRDSTGAAARTRFNPNRESDMLATLDLASGGRALSENLQLDRVLPTNSNDKSERVRTDSIEGITVRGFDWGPRIKDLEPQTDSLAALIPEDQHALFFPSFAAMIQLADQADEQGTPLLQSFEPRAVDAMTRKRYEKQLCLPVSEIARLVGPHLVNSVAVTGSDPYLRTGSDVAILFEAKMVAALRALIGARVDLAGAEHAGAEPVNGEVEGLAYSGVRSPDREVCAYVATLGGAVVVTNSLAQLRRLALVASGKVRPLSALPEYTFFRDRYKQGDAQETALLIISDQTIRRWCGPRWRIGTSRRTRVAAVLAEAQAQHMGALVTGQFKPDALTDEVIGSLPDVGELRLTPLGVRSADHGTLYFLTPVIEMELDTVTKSEAELYERWRRGYQQNWTGGFDPIALRLSAAADHLAADLTVMPLIDNTQYRQMIDVSRGAAIKQGTGDQHAGALLHIALALNKDSGMVRQGASFAMGMAQQLRVDPLGWLGQTVALYADEDPFWGELAKLDENERDRFFEQNMKRLPVVLRVQVGNGFKLAAFLTSLRAYIDQTVPGMMVWESKKHGEIPYVSISQSAEARRDEMMDFSVHYAASGEALIVTLSEVSLKRALDRQAARAEARAEGKALPWVGAPWLGENFCLQAYPEAIQLLSVLFRDNYEQAMQQLAWGNLPILNEWRRLYPDQDPVALHQRVWHQKLICPGGGEYRWDAKWHTMESTVYGHPTQPRRGPGLPVALRDLSIANFGVTFEENGLRAKVQIKRSVNK